MKFIQKLAFCAAFLVVSSASAGALYWQVDTANAGFNGYTESTEGAYAALWATRSSNTGLPDAVEGTSHLVDGYFSLDEATKFVTDDLGTYGTSEYSFFVEIVNASGESWVQKQATTYTELVSLGYISTSPLSVPPSGGGMNGAAVPEPTSGVLMLIGGAMLALRRRRRS